MSVAQPQKTQETRKETSEKLPIDCSGASAERRKLQEIRTFQPPKVTGQIGKLEQLSKP
jgi:hypothetical protein